MIKFLVMKTLTTRIVYKKGLDRGCNQLKTIFPPVFARKNGEKNLIYTQRGDKLNFFLK